MAVERAPDELASADETSPDGERPTVFVSYRRHDSPGSARELAGACTRRFGVENVFFDTQALTPGSDWSQQIVQRVARADVVLVVIGPNWALLADERSRRSGARASGMDVLRTEIETALRGDGLVIPVLVDDASIPDREDLPRPFRPLTGLQATRLRHDCWESDVELLLSAVERQVAQRSQDDSPGTSMTTPDQSAAAWAQAARGGNLPDDSHFSDVLEYLEEGLLLPVLGPGVYESDENAEWEPGCGWLPSPDELARALAKRFRLDPEPAELTRVSQHIVLTRGARDLHRALREMLIKPDCEPSPVHEFLARLPGILRERGSERYPLILTTNYDTALERAFDAAQEPFDLAVYLADGPHKTKFLHIPWWDGSGSTPRVILDPNSYIDFPIHDDGELSRTILVKIHGGALHDAPPEFQLKNNFLATEDDYIGYLSRNPVETFIPLQILDKLSDSHLLFLGYGVRDWNLRVFLRRLWEDGRAQANSWAIQRRFDKVDRGLWEILDVERFDLPLAVYLSELERRLTS